MRFVRNRTLRALQYEEPPDLDTWREARWGLGATTSRVATYAGIVMFLVVNYCLVTMPVPGLLDCFAAAQLRYGRGVTVGAFALALFLLGVLHEACHVLFHPDHGLSSRSLAGMKPFGPFVLYNGGMSRRRFTAYLLGPLLLLTPLTLGVVVAAGGWWPLYANLFFAHLAMTFGDLAMVWHFRRRHGDCREVWNAGRRVLVR